MAGALRFLSRCLALAVMALASGAGCDERPLHAEPPLTGGWGFDWMHGMYTFRVDLLLVIDNSASMADKQAILQRAVPVLLERLMVPGGDSSSQSLGYDPVQDIHVGVITSSLGGHGADICAPGGPGYHPSQVDNARLLGSVRKELAQYQDKGFLWWDPTDHVGGETDPAAFLEDLKEQVGAAGEDGCGYEAPLEAWYRFLIDPRPPQKVVLYQGSSEIIGPDPVILQQRADFLRPDSLVAIVMLSDENDCSIADGGQSWIVGQQVLAGEEWHLPRATTGCQTEPDSECCRSCKTTGATPAGCTPIDEDPECQQNDGFYDDTGGGDHVNLRCFEQKRRFGIDFLYPTDRYVQGLTRLQICPLWSANGPAPNCATVPNPLYSGAVSRDKSFVVLAGIVGVPWQDVATEQSLTGPGLELMPAQDLELSGRWSWMLPDGPGDLPDDPLMIESIDPRSGKQPATGKALADPNASSPTANPINGHEWNILDRGDLQYACIFPLAAPRDCGAVQSSGCDCKNVPAVGYTANNPLCQDPATGKYSKVQRAAKAYPGLRQLQVLRALEENAIVASICPKVTTGAETEPSFGYNPVMEALTPHLANHRDAICLNRTPQVDPKTGDVACRVIEVTPSAGSCAPCSERPSRSEVYDDPELDGLTRAVLFELEARGRCGVHSADQLPCDEQSFCMCGIEQVGGACLTDPSPSHLYGWCYVDAGAEPPVGDADLVSSWCNPKRALRFVGIDVPVPGATLVVACRDAQLPHPAVPEAADGGP